MNNTATFEMNSKAYTTDMETLTMLRGLVAAGRAADDMSAVIFAMELGQIAGRITLVGKA